MVDERSSEDHRDDPDNFERLLRTIEPGEWKSALVAVFDTAFMARVWLETRNLKPTAETILGFTELVLGMEMVMRKRKAKDDADVE